jgi:hypothetical protein
MLFTFGSFSIHIRRRHKSLLEDRQLRNSSRRMDRATDEENRQKN